jgi:hypothetical protein
MDYKTPLEGGPEVQQMVCPVWSFSRTRCGRTHAHFDGSIKILQGPRNPELVLQQPAHIRRRAGRVLTLTAKGRGMLGDPDHLWRATAGALPGGNSFTVFAGELFLAMLADGKPLPASQVTATVAQAAAEEEFRDSRTGQPPGEHDISWAISRTANLCRALDLLAPGSDWRDRRYQLTPAGTATALEALRARATGPGTLT